MWAGGWEVYGVMGVGGMVVVGLFAVAVGVIVMHDVEEDEGLRP